MLIYQRVITHSFYHDSNPEYFNHPWDDPGGDMSPLCWRTSRVRTFNSTRKSSKCRHLGRTGQSEARPKNAEELQLGSWPAMIFLHLMVIYGCCNIKRLSTSSTIEMWWSPLGYGFRLNHQPVTIFGFLIWVSPQLRLLIITLPVRLVYA